MSVSEEARDVDIARDKDVEAGGGMEVVVHGEMRGILGLGVEG